MSEKESTYGEHADDDPGLSFEEEVAQPEEDDDPHTDFPTPDPDGRDKGRRHRSSAPVSASGVA